MDNTTVKLDGELLKRIKKLLKKASTRIKYSNLKQFVNIAVLNLLEDELKKDNKKEVEDERI